MPETNIIHIGRKPTINYVMACLDMVQNGEEVLIIKARGNSISTAVDVAQILKKRFITDIDVKKTTIGTEQVKNIETGETNNINSMEIILGK